MVKNFKELFNQRIKRFFRQKFYRITEINRQYANPRIKMTPLVSFSLVFLRFYLLFLVALLFFKFFTIVKGS